MVSQERVNGRQVFPAPENGACVAENPPVFVWLPFGQGKEVSYECMIWDQNGKLCRQGVCKEHFYVPEEALDAGCYQWDVKIAGKDLWRGKQSFQVPEEAIIFKRPTAEEVIRTIPEVHPRHLFKETDRSEIIKDKWQEVETLKRNIRQAYEDGFPQRPMYHTDSEAIPYREYFGRFRDFCDRNLVACALGYSLLGDQEAGDFARKLFLHICDWNPAGPCSLLGPWGDEVGLSCARCFPAVYDMLHPLMTEKERRYAGETLVQYAQQCERRLEKIDFALNPGDSHAGRLPAYLGETALVLWGEDLVSERTLCGWLEKALYIYGSFFPHYGGEDGSWAEGVFYSTSYTKWYLPFFSAIARYTGKNFLQRPFYRNYARYLLHFGLPDHEIHPFGDGYWCDPDSEEWPGFYAQNPFRVYAELSGLEEAAKYEKVLGAPKLFQLHLLDVFLPKQKIQDGYQAAQIKNAECFTDGGFISLHSDHTDPTKDLHLIARASKFGPGSHRNPDNGSFSVFYGGKAFITPSGYFGRAYGSKHHMGWLNNTKAHNVILVDGVGQSWEDFRHTAQILSCEEKAGSRKASVDLKSSYPMLESYERNYEIVGDDRILIEDRIRAKEPVVITYPIHTLSKPEQADGMVRIIREDAAMLMHIEGADDVVISDQYDVALNAGEPEEYHVVRPLHYHIYWNTKAKKEHCIRLWIQIEKEK